MSPVAQPTHAAELRAILSAARDGAGPVPSRAELAEALGVARSCVSRLLLQLEADGELPCAPRGTGLHRVPRGRRPLTARQAEVLAFVAGHVADHQRSPTVREISAHFGWTSTNAASDHLKALAAKGYLALDAVVARGIRVVDPHAVPLERMNRILDLAYLQHVGAPNEGRAKHLRAELRELAEAWPEFARRVGVV